MKKQTTANWLIKLLGEEYWSGQFGLEQASEWELEKRISRIIRLAKLRRHK